MIATVAKFVVKAPLSAGLAVAIAVGSSMQPATAPSIRSNSTTFELTPIVQPIATEAETRSDEQTVIVSVVSYSAAAHARLGRDVSRRLALEAVAMAARQYVGEHVVLTADVSHDYDSPVAMAGRVVLTVRTTASVEDAVAAIDRFDSRFWIQASARDGAWLTVIHELV